MDDSRANYICEIVNKASILQAIKFKHIQAQEVLEWLTKVKVTKTTIIVYRIVSVVIEPDKQYLSNGEHFLLNHHDYIPCAVKVDLGMDAPIKKNSHDQMYLVLSRYKSDIEKLYKKQEKFLDFIFSSMASPEFVELNIHHLYKLHETLERHMEFVTPSEHIDHLLEVDWPIKLSDCPESITKLIERVEYLRKEFHEYYQEAASIDYTSTVREWFEENKLVFIENDLLMKLYTYFPGVFPEEILELPEFGQRILLYSPDIRNYLLGFPIHIMTPSKQQVISKVKLLVELGPEEYVKRLKCDHRTCGLTVSENIKYANDTDALLIEVEEYSPFDVVPFIRGEHIYRFVRPEFGDIKKKGRNPWTNEELPDAIYFEVDKRIQLAKKLKLPYPQSMVENFKELPIIESKSKRSDNFVDHFEQLLNIFHSH